MKQYKHWWTNKWFSIINGKRIGKKYDAGVRFYKKEKDEIIHEKSYQNRLWASTWEFEDFEDMECEVRFKPFTDDEIKFIKDLIETSPTYMINLALKNFPIELYEKIEAKNIELFPNYISDLDISCNCNIRYCKHSMRIFHHFGLEFDKDPLLIFEFKGLNLKPILNSIEIKNIRDIKTFEEQYQTNNKTKAKTKKIKTKNHSKKLEVLKTINFKDIPKLKKIIDMFLEAKPDFFDGNFKSIFLRNLSYQGRNMNFPMSDRLKLDFKPFIHQRPNESDIEYKKRTFLMKWDEPKYLKPLEIKINEFNDIKEISILPDGENLKYILHEFFFEMEEELLTEYDYTIQYTYKLFKFSEVLIKQIAIIPEILFNKRSKNQYILRWIPALFNPIIQEKMDLLVKCFPKENLVIFNRKEIPIIEQIKIILGIFIGNFMEKNLPKVLLKHESSLEFKLLFSNHPVEGRDGDVKKIHKWLNKLFLFETKRKISIKIDVDDNFIINLFLGKSQFNKEFKKLNEKDRNEVFYEISLLSQYCEELNDIINNNKELVYSLEEFNDFYFEKIPILESLNFNVTLPNTLKKITIPEIVADFKTTSDVNVNEGGLLNLASLIEFNWEIALGKNRIPLKDFKKLVAKSKSFIKFNDNYYFIDEKRINQLSKDIDELPEKMKNNEILQAILSLKHGEANINIDANLKKSIKEIFKKNDLKVPKNINAVLRDYQIRGFSWLVQNTMLGFGSILADDMGLGKTLEVLTAIQYFKNQGSLENQKVLVIAPTAILFNWENEIKKFTPELSVKIYHGTDRTITQDMDILITSYGILRSDMKEFSKFKWFMVVVDEAQNIKNPNAKQTKVIKQLDALNKIALTGTPVENKLLDYWSIFDFTNKNYLYGKTKFNKLFAKPIKEKDESSLEKFKKITSPFILRRLKTDQKIINDLPEKISNDCYCFLSKKQATMYQKIINEILDEIEKSEGIQRKGLVLKLINALKQICNHPSQYLKSKNYSAKDSGKMEMLIDILENTEENKEKVVIFTQFVKMGNIIVDLVEEKFNTEVLFYHGSLNRKNRDKIITEFQNNDEKRVMVVSLKAGGSGLNLTAGVHVVHFDLWWNPAVENQATDRVHRIGQENNVFIYRFITKGTFEEKINKLLLEKSNLAELTIGTGESFVTEMSNEELKTLLTLNTIDNN
ncbi:MAG: DEAD/DEAH box helicase [Methanobrevibacter sp.]|jgi:SNF2 family DNA or RNA helicase/uncharacterized Zn finger protein|nr:DEAD/DEAH box helicase [Candidatus Methanoflexus mossambicus]